MTAAVSWEKRLAEEKNIPADTKAMIFCFENHELCFAKQDCWFSQEIEIYKGHDLLAKIGDGNDILDDFDEDETKKAFVERTIVEIK